jgi:hypothetical protein
MWTCTKCREQIEESFDSCWKCSTARGVLAADAASQEAATPKGRLAYRVFRGTWATWEELFSQAAAFANELGPEKVVSISHSEDDDDGVVAVWYWTNDDNPT